MTSSAAALPGAALRVLRTAAGRRALQVVVLVGGLFALGFLCGERASAAEGVPTVTSHGVASVAPVTSVVPVDGVRSLTRDTVERLVTPPTEADAHPTAPPPQAQPAAPAPDARPVAPAPAPAPEAHAAAPPLSDLTDTTVEDKVLRPVTEQVVGVVDGKVVQPVGDLVETVTEQLAEAQTQLPNLPAFPAVPEFPVLPEAPGLPVVPVLPGQTLPAPVTATPQPGSPADGSTDGQDSAGSNTSDKARAKASRVGGDYGPSSLDGSPVTGTAPKADRHRAATSGGYLPAHPAPAGDRGGALANRSGVDNGSPRHGDAQAVSLNDRAPLRLVPGGVVRTDADGTRDRHRDIPVSPA
ncbi:hypothetical protein [Streptomyces justiciae]|uniref:Secreted protein n=1 Tax=Streptomyces justiciae TaxID=2780140 RepID=A0ABU3LNG9_9ACTN|nr:hypothetical protein [Streptomyces justiciae]MDT7840717.1 hypothetical protein [Streptomyces justiciae]